MAEPVRTKRTVMLGSAEPAANYPYINSAGVYTTSDLTTAFTPTITPAVIPVYDVFNIFQAEIETNPMNRARGTLDPERFWIGITTSRIQGNFYVFGTGNASAGYDAANLAASMLLLPAWAQVLLPSAGFTPSQAIPATDEHICFTPTSDTFFHAYLDVYLNKHRHVCAGARGNLVFSCTAGNPVQVAFDFMGLYAPATVTVNPSDAGSDPGLPPRACGIDTFHLRSEHSSEAFQPALKSFTLDLGVQVTQRRNANTYGCLQEVGIFAEFNPRLTVVIEVDNYDALLATTGEDFIEACRAGEKFAFELNVGPYVDGSAQGGRWQFRNYNAAATSAPNILNTEAAIEAASVFRASLVRAPQYVDVDGIRCYELEFLLGGTDNNFLQIIAM